jgi:hypothetical protein
MRPSLFISADVLTKLVEGSYESLITRVQKLVDEQRVAIFGEGADELQIRVGATYSHHAILISTAAHKPVVRIEFSESAPGVLKLVRHEVVPVPTYDATERGDYAQLEARRAVDALLAGDVVGATARLQESMRHVDPVRRSASELMGALTEHVQAPSKWRAAVTGSHASAAEKFLGEQYSTIRSCLPTLRYRGRCGLVLADVRMAVEPVIARLESITHRVQGTRQRLASTVLVLTESARSELATFDNLAEDLVRDSQVLRKLAKESLRGLDNPENLAQVYDALADALFEYEIATAYFGSLVERLTR